MPKIPPQFCEYYAYVWRLNGEVLWVGQGKGRRSDPLCKASWSGRPQGLLDILETQRQEIKVEIQPCLSKEASWVLEERLIAELKPKFNTAPHHGGWKGMHSPEALANISQLNTGRKRTEESKVQHSERMKGNKHLLGHVHSEETRAKISNALRGREVSEKTRVSASQRMTERNKVNPPRKGKVCSEEHKRKVSEARKLFFLRKKQNASLNS